MPRRRATLTWALKELRTRFEAGVKENIRKVSGIRLEEEIEEEEE